MKPLALDLCCGKGGWTIGLQAAGWDVIGFDVQFFEGYPGKFVQGDIRDTNFGKYKGRVGLVVASPPCTEFSYRDLPFGRVKNLPPPDLSIFEACITAAKIIEAPVVIENVRGARTWVGPSKANYGSFYLWGDVPLLLPAGKPKPKGLQLNRPGYERKGICERNTGAHSFWSNSKERKEWSAKAAMIPFELAHWIGECFYPKETS